MVTKALKKDEVLLSRIIKQAFQDVALRFSLTKDNCSRHPSNCEPSWIKADMARGVQYFILFDGGCAAGCVGVEQADANICYLERLSVLPKMRGCHFGIRLVQYALRYAASLNVQKVSVGVIAEQAELKAWYRALGFVEIQTKSFSHLPFDVCLMESTLK